MWFWLDARPGPTRPASQPASYADGDGGQCGGGNQDQYGDGDFNRQVTSISIHMVKPGLATALRGHAPL